MYDSHNDPHGDDGQGDEPESPEVFAGEHLLDGVVEEEVEQREDEEEVQERGSGVVDRKREQNADGDADEPRDPDYRKLPAEIVHLHNAVYEEVGKCHIDNVAQRIAEKSRRKEEEEGREKRRPPELVLIVYYYLISM